MPKRRQHQFNYDEVSIASFPLNLTFSPREKELSASGRLVSDLSATRLSLKSLSIRERVWVRGHPEEAATRVQ